MSISNQNPLNNKLLTIGLLVAVFTTSFAVGVSAADWVSSGNNIYYDAGNVGIGTSTPGYALEVKSNGMPLKLSNTSDTASNQALIIRGNSRAAAANGDKMYLSYMMTDKAQLEREAGRMTFTFSDASSNSKNSSFKLELLNSNGLKDVLSINHNPNNTGAVVLNEAGYDLDMRMESDLDANALFLDGTTGNLGIGTSTPTSKLQVQGDLKVNGIITSDGDICIGSGC